MTYFEGSALTNLNVEAAFTHLIREVRIARKGGAGGDGTSALMAAKRAAQPERRRGFCTLL